MNTHVGIDRFACFERLRDRLADRLADARTLTVINERGRTMNVYVMFLCLK